MFLLTYDVYMSEEKMKEILPQAQIEMRCLLKGYRLQFVKIYENIVLKLLKSDLDMCVSAVIWNIKESELTDIEKIYSTESYDKLYFHITTENTDIVTVAYIPKNTVTMFPTNEYIEDIIKAYEEHNFDFCCIEYALDNIKFNYERHT